MMSDTQVTVVGGITLLIALVLAALFGVLLWYVLRALRKYLRSAQEREKAAAVKRSLGEVLRAHRTRRQMTQEFVAERLGVSRQAVSKWETGTADPSTTNLLALARLYGVSPEELLRAAAGEGEPPPETS